jgi:DNA excision repair protein ERCC-2
MVLADRRFLKKRTQLPKWIHQAMLESEVNLSTDMAVGTAKKFLRGMAQPFKNKDQEGISTWSLADLEKYKEKEEEEMIRAMREAEIDGTNAANQGVDVVMQGNEGRVAQEDEYGFDDDELEAGMMDIDGN